MTPDTSPATNHQAATAILSALPEEQQGLIGLLVQPQKVVHAGRDFWLGSLHGQPVVLALSRIGKVAAATTAAALIERFQVARILFTGVAGGLGEGVQVGDVVVAEDFLQHDMDASPIFPRYEVPLYGQTRFAADPALSALLLEAARSALQHNWPYDGRLAFPGARLHHGLMASGDQFISGTAESGELRRALAAAGHAVLAVEMEGAAVAQVCHDYGLPFASVRTISDRADDQAHADFPTFVRDIASQYARVIVEKFLQML
ncbi:MAG: 5'-methylthioadenosine/adenosylhomocysteine nucleosidase [Polaromonas sp.]|nr:5'-methylthioadenosine/adenosylhomocysteine nucleosidase [Polaromonas sp.]